MRYYRRAKNRGTEQLSWLTSKHTFSFGSYYDPNHMGISALRVINDDLVSPGAGFDTHGHRDMEIISYVLEGSIEHRDSLGNRFIIPAGEVQRMSAGTGITHSEFNHSGNESLRFLQIWIQPNVAGSQPSYEQKSIQQSDVLTPLVTPDGRDGSLSMQQDASIYRLQLAPGETFSLAKSNRPGYLHILNGSGEIGQCTLSEGDGLGILDEAITIKANQPLSALWFDLPSVNHS
ncbi:pirin family protein [Sessilibacter corallicola]|uniref:Pirin family protein n=1 Tax=Sessilibacter corallicola TaxID=2904075 RepID=A0ABQ0ADK8_9GAMM